MTVVSINNRLQALLFLGLAAVLSLLPGCGGGTSGTGVQTYEGTIRSSKSEPLAGVNILLVESGASAVSNQNGDFTLTTEPVKGTVTLLLNSPEVNTSVVLKGNVESDSRIAVNIKVDTDRNAAEIENYTARVSMVGACDRYFENGDEIIRQANQVPVGTHCTLKVLVYGDGEPSGNIPIGLQRSACPSGAPWETIGGTETGVGVERGIAQLQFRYGDTERSCKYRILVPFGIRGKKPLQFYISTFTQQDFEK